MSHADRTDHVSFFFMKYRLVHLCACVLTTALHSPAATAQAPVTLERSTTLEETSTPGTSHQYELRLKRGESAELVVHQRGVDVVVDVKGPEGKLLNSIDGPTGRSGDELVEIMAGKWSIRHHRAPFR